jgi:hypothetical protein
VTAAVRLENIPRQILLNERIKLQRCVIAGKNAAVEKTGFG